MKHLTVVTAIVGLPASSVNWNIHHLGNWNLLLLHGYYQNTSLGNYLYFWLAPSPSASPQIIFVVVSLKCLKMSDRCMQLLCCHVCDYIVLILWEFNSSLYICTKFYWHCKNFQKSIFQVACWRHFYMATHIFLNYIILVSWILFFPGYYSNFRSPLHVINSLNVKKTLCFRLEMSLLPVLFHRRFSFTFSYPLWQVKFLSGLLCVFLLWWLH